MTNTPVDGNLIQIHCRGMYNFYTSQFGVTMGPYTAQELNKLGLPDDTKISEPEITHGEWVLLRGLDLDKVCLMEKAREKELQDANEKRWKNNTAPKCLNSWNWGAFTFPGLWGLFNGVYWPIIIQVGRRGYFISNRVLFFDAYYLGCFGEEWK